MKKKNTLATLLVLAALTLVCTSADAAETMGTVSIKLPTETAAFKPGPGADMAKKYCTICHSADYIYMQPPLSQEAWHGEVSKMQKTYGCPIRDQDIDTVTSYLESQNGTVKK